MQLAPVVHLGPFDASGKLTNDACIKSGAYVHRRSFCCGATGGFSNNRALGLPTADGIMCVFGQKSGLLEAILLDEGYLTDLRTAAAGAVAARYLGRCTRLSHIGVIGAGIQARFPKCGCSPAKQNVARFWFGGGIARGSNMPGY